MIKKLPISPNRLHILGTDAQINPITGQKLNRGIYSTDKIHTLVMGFPGCGKTRFLLSQIKQNIDNNEGFMLLDSHKDLSELVLSHIPIKKYSKVIYINPWTAFEKKFNHRVVQLNFLEYDNPLDRDVIARLFMDTLEKIYERWWGPRLDMIMLNALYLLMEKNTAKIPELYKVIADKEFREMLLAKCNDINVKLFWENEYPKMPKDACIAVLTKIYRIVQERIVIPLFMAQKSSINLRQAIDNKKFIIIDLPEGKLTTDITNFVGSLILSNLYRAAMTREDTPQEKRLPFYVYIDEAYRYTTKSIPEILQSLRKYKIFLTLASQYLEQYRKDIQNALPQTCETLITFKVGEETAKTLQKFYPKKYTTQTFINLPHYKFFASTILNGKHEHQILQTIDYTTGKTNPTELIKKSLQTCARPINIEELIGETKPKTKQQEFLDWPITPAEWNILLKIRLAGGQITETQLLDQLAHNPKNPKPYTLKYIHIANSLKNLAIDNIKRNAWINYKKTTKNTSTIKNPKRTIQQRLYYLLLQDKQAKLLLNPQFKNEKAGDIPHIQAITKMRNIYWQNGWITRTDTGETSESIADLYVTPTKPLFEPETNQTYIDPNQWDYTRAFAVEIESYPHRHYDRVKNNYERNKKMGFPTLFIVFDNQQQIDLTNKLIQWGAIITQNTSSFQTNQPEMATVQTINLNFPSQNQPPPLLPPPNTTHLINQVEPNTLLNIIKNMQGWDLNLKPPKITITNIKELNSKPPEIILGSSKKLAQLIVQEFLTTQKTKTQQTSQTNQKQNISTKTTPNMCPKPLNSQTNKKTTLQPPQLQTTNKKTHPPNQSIQHKENHILKFKTSGYSFRVKQSKTKLYLCARKNKKEHSLGSFDQQTKQLLQKHNINLKGKINSPYPNS